MALFVVSTPIGNLQDITLRALDTLKTVSKIACEDTRTTQKLTSHFGITTPLISFHSYSNQKKLDFLIEELVSGKDIALVSDAGTPGISDPGYALIEKAVQNNITIVPIPGASAFLSGLQASGAPINHFIYYGFLPVKKGRQTLLKTFPQEEKTIVFYESVHRIVKTLNDLKAVLGGQRSIIIARELTKLHEEFFRGNIDEALEHFTSPRGEFVVILPASHFQEKEE